MIAASVILCWGLTTSTGCHKETEQEKVKKVITRIQQAAEEKDIRTILNNLSRNYKDPLGNDYDTINLMLLGYFSRNQKIHAFITNIDITVQDSIAKAVFQAVLSGRNNPESAADILPERSECTLLKYRSKKSPTSGS
jgi:hypothetical protein